MPRHRSMSTAHRATTRGWGAEDGELRASSWPVALGLGGRHARAHAHRLIGNDNNRFRCISPPERGGLATKFCWQPKPAAMQRAAPTNTKLHCDRCTSSAHWPEFVFEICFNFQEFRFFSVVVPAARQQITVMLLCYPDLMNFVHTSDRGACRPRSPAQRVLPQDLAMGRSFHVMLP